MDEKIDFELSKLEIHDGDIIKIKLSPQLLSEDRYNIGKRVKDKLKEQGKEVIVFLMSNDTDIETLPKESIKLYIERLEQFLKELEDKEKNKEEKKNA